MKQSAGLSNLQLELLKLFAYNLPDNQLIEIRRMLANYFAQQIDSEMDKLWDEKKWDQSTIQSWKSTHMRTPYHPK